MDAMTTESYPMQWEVPLVEDGGAFRTRNKKGQTFRHVLQNTPARAANKTHLFSRVTIMGIAHGHWAAGKGADTTLMVLKFQFGSTADARKHRIKRLTLTLRFDYVDPGGDDEDPSPLPIRTIPNGTRYYDRVEVTHESAKSADVGIGSGNLLPVDLRANFKWEVRETFAADYSAKVVCMPATVRDGGYQDDAVTWTFVENPKKAQGIPTLLQTAVVIQRRPGVPFNVDLDITCDTVPSVSLPWWGGGLIEEIEKVQLTPGTVPVCYPGFVFEKPDVEAEKTAEEEGEGEGGGKGEKPNTDVSTAAEEKGGKRGDGKKQEKKIPFTDHLGTLPLEPYLELAL